MLTLTGGLLFAGTAFGATPPEAPVTVAGPVTGTSAVFEGTLNPHSKATVGGYFAYSNPEGLTCAEGPTAGLEGFEGEQEVQAQAVHALVGLEPDRKYKFCLVATNEGGVGVTPGNEVEVVTPAIPPTVEAEGVSGVSSSGATLEAIVNTNNQEVTKCEFLYGTDATLAASTSVPCEQATLPGTYAGQYATAAVSPLLQQTKYYYRVIVENVASEKREGAIEHFTTLLETPETLPASPVTVTAATLNGVLSPNATAQGEQASYEFVYQQSPSECQGAETKTAPAPAGVADGGKEAVSVSLTGLPPAATYTYCLLERSAGGETATGAAVTFTTHGAGISEEYVSKVEESTAILHAKIDPNESSTTYHFEYDTSPYTTGAAHGTSLPSVVIPPGTSIVPVSVPLQSLEPHTTYYYRVVAVSELSPTEFETFDGPGKTFTTNPAPSTAAETCPNAQARAEQPYGQALPDCRAYELVSPLEKSGFSAEAIDSRASVSDQPSGPEASAVAYVSKGSFTEPQGARKESRYISRRGADGWSTQNVTPLSLAFNPQSVAFQELVFTPSLSQGVLYSEDVPLAAGEEPGYRNLYVAELASNPVSYQTVTNGIERYPAESSPPTVLGASTDLSHVVFQEETDDKGQGGGVFEWADGKLSLVDVPPAGTKFEQQDTAGAPGNKHEPIYGDTWHAVSANGQRVFFTAGEGFGHDQEGQLYVRENPEREQSPLTPFAAGTGELTSGSDIVTSVATETSGDFLLGQEITGYGIQPGTMIAAVGSGTLTLSKDATASGGSATGTGDFTAGSTQIDDVVTTAGNFVAGQGISGPGIPPYTKIEAIDADGQIILSAKATLSESSAALQAGVIIKAGGECTEPADACTVEVSASQRTTPDPNGPRPAYFRDANTAGTRVFFTSRAELTNDANTGSADNTANLYEYDFEKPEGKRLADLTVNAEPKGAAVLGLVNAGENVGEENSYVYFVANGVLASNENANKETAQPGNCKQAEEEVLMGEHTCSLYVAHYEGGEWNIKFIATLAGGNAGAGHVYGDEKDWVGLEGGGLNLDEGPGQHTVRVTPDGTTLAFESERGLTGYDNEPLEPGAGASGHKCTEKGGELESENPAVPCREVYVYHVESGSHPPTLVCASCDPSGARPVGPAVLGGQESEAANGLLHPSTYYLPRNLSESGGRLFFQSPDALVPHDSDDQLNVYEWEQPASPSEIAKGENSCSSSAPTFSASDGGCVFPISDVAGDFESRFMDATPSGNNVFIATKDQLVPEADADSRANVYDVRVGGGFPVTTSPPSCNNGDSCKPPVSPQPSIFAPSGSATFSGLGNPAPAVAPPPPAVKPKALTKAQKLANALKSCKKDKKKAKRVACEKQAKKAYGVAKKTKKSAHTNRRAK
jgi:hypothetical protein